MVSIIREAVKLEEQAAQKSVLKLQHEGRDYKLGVIKVPAFYLDFKAYRAQDPNYKSTTRDVKRLLGELKQEKVDGVVIDLRDNGGGSLQEATELTGLFIGNGNRTFIGGRTHVCIGQHGYPAGVKVQSCTSCTEVPGIIFLLCKAGIGKKQYK